MESTLFASTVANETSRINQFMVTKSMVTSHKICFFGVFRLVCPKKYENFCSKSVRTMSFYADNISKGYVNSFSQ